MALEGDDENYRADVHDEDRKQVIKLEINPVITESRILIL
jgi:hypothetical protein